MKTQICNVCSTDKPETEFSKGNKNTGLSYTCKICTKIYHKNWYQKNKEKVKAAVKDRLKDPVKKARKAERDLEWRRENPEKNTATARRWRDKYPDRWKEYLRKYREENPEQMQVNTDKRRERLANAGGGVFHQERPEYQARVDRYGGKCAYCGTAEATELDHAIPVSRGGSNHPANIYPACKPCNLRKGKKLLHKEYRVSWSPT